jgi:hypothetical protein
MEIAYMLSFTTRAAVEAAVADPALDPQLRTLLAARALQLEDDTEPGVELGDLAHFHIAQPGDEMAAVNAAIGFPVDANLVDGVRFGDPEFTPSWEWIEDHGGWFEAAFVLSDDGFGHVLLVLDRPDIDPRLLALCRGNLTPA